jgi:Cu2+-exporting ATPase
MLGHWIANVAISQASGALRELAKLLPSTAQRIVGETIEDVPISVLREGDVVLERPGASVPADGIVLSGKSDVNESMITGESVPVPRSRAPKSSPAPSTAPAPPRDGTGTGRRTRSRTSCGWLNRRRRRDLVRRPWLTAQRSY